MSEQDVQIATLREVLEMCREVKQRFGDMPGVGVSAVMRRIEWRMQEIANEQELAKA